MADLKKTPLHAAHLDAGAKLVDFTGWHMPLQYAGGILAEHEQVRTAAGLFDVSHMGEIDFEGVGAFDTVQRLVTNDISKLTDGKALYTVVCLPDGGIVDDCIVYRFDGEKIRIVVNASNIAKDEAHFREYCGKQCSITNRSEEIALIAIQGPKAVATLARLAHEPVDAIAGFAFGPATVAGVGTVAARTGYTGEDGFELFVPADGARKVWDALMEAGATPAGLGARDTLRLEAKLSLYGNDIDETTTPYEATLGWTVKPDAGDFIGRDALLAQKAAGLQRKLIGFKVVGRGIVRPGAILETPEGQEIGTVTSGGVAPTVGGSVGIGYAAIDHAKVDAQLVAVQRKKRLDIRVHKGPFYRRAS